MSRADTADRAVENAVSRADAADRALEDLKQQLQLLNGQVEEGHTRLAAQTAQLTDVQGHLHATRQQLQALKSTTQVHAALILRQYVLLVLAVLQSVHSDVCNILGH